MSNKDAFPYIRAKLNQLLTFMGTLPLGPEELDDATLLELDPIGIVADSFAQMIAHLNETNHRLNLATDEIRAIFDTLGAAVVALDQHDRLDDCNRRALDWFFWGTDRGVGYFLLKEVPQGADPLGAENKLIFAAGPLTGVPAGGCGRHCVGAKSPLTGGYGEAESGGYWGAELKMAGLDAIIIEGMSHKPVYLSIKDGTAELKDASHLWGMKALELQTAIREELGDARTKVAYIGPAGENLVLYASIANDLDAFAGRTGMGAVMGSKKLKAIAVRGHNRVQIADSEAFKQVVFWIRDNTPTISRGLAASRYRLKSSRSQV